MKFFLAKTKEKTDFYWFLNMKSNWKLTFLTYLSRIFGKTVPISFEMIEVQNLV